ncbi:MAG: hypothetical protein NZO58_12815, partial [Gemmataceae bacterium]|nr:hypothetical protein [Gemmataceae bacterium]
MNDVVNLPRPWSERQRETLRDFLRHAAQRAQQEVEIQTTFVQQDQAIDKEFREVRQKLDHAFHAARQRAVTEFETRQAEALSS